MSKHLFSVFDVTRQVFHATPLSLAIVNLKPLLPGHVLVLPRNIVPRLKDLNAEEITDLFLTVQRVGNVVEKAYKAESLTISIQDGSSAGQSVPHVHVHILPRFKTDFKGKNDDIYPALESSEQGLKGDLQCVEGTPSKVGGLAHQNGRREVGEGWDVKDEDRRPRSIEEMEEEANWLKGFF